MIKKADVIRILKSIPDPELNISIWDLGLVYGVAVDQKAGLVTVTMTLTSMGCPLFSLISGPIEEDVKAKVTGVRDVRVDLTFDPPWTTDKMSQEAKDRLGI